MKLKSISTPCFLLLLIGLLASCRKPIDIPKNNGDQLAISNLRQVVTQLPNEQYMHLTFATPSTGFAVSNQGLIVKTQDEGKTWQTVASLGNDMLLTKVQFTDEQNGFVIAGDSNGGYLFKTNDGGNNWTKKDFNPVQAGVPNDMFFLDKNIGFITGVNLFIKTSDGGNTWTNVLANNTYNFSKVCFKNTMEGYATCNNGVYFKTTNGGNTWESTALNSRITLKDIYFAGAKVFFKAASGLLDISNPYEIISLPAGATNLLFLNEVKCIAAGEHYEGGFWPYGDILVTNDLWKTNEKYSFQPSQAYTFKCIAKMNDHTGMAIGYGTGAMVVTLSW